MRWWRHSRLARAVAMILLLWTAADLTNASLCALDSDQIGGAYSREYALTVTADTTGQAPSQPSHHVDDCFCCSHCVDVHVLVPAVVAEPIARREPPLDPAVPLGFGFPLYHPPLA
jgi:hypothetical protein